jgi:hypothetical protein
MWAHLIVLDQYIDSMEEEIKKKGVTKTDPQFLMTYTSMIQAYSALYDAFMKHRG